MICDVMRSRALACLKCIIYNVVSVGVACDVLQQQKTIHTNHRPLYVSHVS